MTDSPRSHPSTHSNLDGTERGENSGAYRGRELASFLLDIGAVELRPSDPFTWSSGLVAPIYCDNRRTIAYPRIRRAIRDAFAGILREQSLLPATIAGTATAGIPHAAWLAEAVDEPMAYVRSSAKGHGQGARVEGVVESGDPVVLVEDLISTGGSALDAVRALRDVGATVPAVFAIFSYQLDVAASAFADANVDRYVLTTFETLVDVAYEQSDLSDEERAVLRTWRSDPEEWSVRNGGQRAG